MSESATAETAYFHTLTARPYCFPTGPRNKHLADIVSRLGDLPAELRWKILKYAFGGNRVAVTAKHACYCATETTGPYRADHQWLLQTPPPRVTGEAQRAFIQTAMWELHCKQAMYTFIERMRALHYLNEIRHIRLNVYELDPAWTLDLSVFPRLQTATFAPWQKGWTIVIPQQPDAEQLSDENVIEKVWYTLIFKKAYRPVRQAFEDKSRTYKMFFVFPIRFHLSSDERSPQLSGNQPRWQLCIWRANLDKRTIERDWKEVHLVQEGTLD